MICSLNISLCDHNHDPRLQVYHLYDMHLSHRHTSVTITEHSSFSVSHKINLAAHDYFLKSHVVLVPVPHMDLSKPKNNNIVKCRDKAQGLYSFKKIFMGLYSRELRRGEGLIFGRKFESAKGTSVMEKV